MLFNIMARRPPSYHLLASIRAYQRHRAHAGPLGKLLQRWAWLRYAFWSWMTSTDIDPRTRIGERVSLPHPLGVVMHRTVTVGDDCMIMQQVTLGIVGTADDGPGIGNNVYIGAGAKLLGPITIGDGARIGANAVVLDDVPPGCTAVGVPARIVRGAQGRRAA